MRAEDTKIFSNIPTITTDRLRLRALSLADVNDVFDYASDPAVSQYLLWSPHESINEIRRYLRLIEKKYRRCEFYDWGVEYNGKLIGTCGFSAFSFSNNYAEIGYVLNSRYWGKGIAAEALKRVIRFGFEELMLNRIEGHFIADNERSLSVMKKCSMTFEGVRKEAMLIKGEYRDIGVAAILANDYYRLKGLGSF